MTAPPKRKGKGRSKPNNNLPTYAPPSLPTPIHGCTSCTYGNWGGHGSRTTKPGTECSQVYCRGDLIDGREVDPLPLHIRAVRSFLIVQRLMPQSQFNMGWNMWRCMAARLFGIAGRYHSMISWAGSAPVPGGTAAWFGASDSSTYTLGRLAAYFAANGVSYEDADNLWWWGQNHLEEL